MDESYHMMDYLVNNKDHIKELVFPSLCKKDYLIMESNHLFHSDINKQYNNEIIQTIIQELTSRLAIDYETALCFVESVDLNEYLK